MANEIVITGMGILSPNGVDKDIFRNALKGGKSGIRPLDVIDTSVLRTRVAGVLDNVVLESLLDSKEQMERLDRVAVFSMIAALKAAADARLERDMDPSLKTGIVLGTSGGPKASVEALAHQTFVEGNPRIRPSLASQAMFHMPAVAVAERLGLNTVAETVSRGSVSGLAALQIACHYLQSEQADIMLVGGVDCPVLPLTFRSYDALRLMPRNYNSEPEKASRPFDLARSGMVLSEGGGFLVLERGDVALSRGAKGYANIAGMAHGFCAHESQKERTKSQADCIRRALVDARLQPSDVEHIQASASGMPNEDMQEADAIRAVFSERASAIPVSAIKSMIGETLGASGIIAVIAETLGMEHSFQPPTINLETPDCGLDAIPQQGRNHAFGTGLINSFDHEGIYASALISKA